MKKRHTILLAATAVVVAGAITGIVLIKAKFADIEKQLQGATVSDVDLTEIADG